MVPGKAEPGYRLEHDPKVGKKVSIRTLKRLRSDAERQKYLTSVFRDSPGRIRRKELKNGQESGSSGAEFSEADERRRPKGVR